MLSVRLHPQLSQHDVMLGRKAIDILYIDNTYCHPSCEFPTRVCYCVHWVYVTVYIGCVTVSIGCMLLCTLGM